MIDRILMIIEVVLLILVVIQGEYIRYYEREVHRIQSEREKERRDWRDAKRRQATKKAQIVVPDIQPSDPPSPFLDRSDMDK